MAYGSKGRATGYGDYYKNNIETPSEEVAEDRVTKPLVAKTKTNTNMVAARKAAIKRRIEMRKAGK